MFNIVIFILNVALLSYCTHHLKDFISPALKECLEDTASNEGWEKIMESYFNPPPEKPYLHSYDYPLSMEEDIQSKFQSLKIGLIEPSHDPYYVINGSGFAGVEIDLVENCVLPRIGSQYSISVNYDYQALDYNQITSFNEFVQGELESNVDFVTSMAFLVDRTDYFDYGQNYLVVEIKCLRTPFERNIVNLTTFDEINRNSTIIVVQSGVVEDYMSTHFEHANRSNSVLSVYNELIANGNISYHMLCYENIALQHFCKKHESYGCEFVPQTSLLDPPMLELGFVFKIPAGNGDEGNDNDWIYYIISIGGANVAVFSIIVLFVLVLIVICCFCVSIMSGFAVMSSKKNDNSKVHPITSYDIQHEKDLNSEGGCKYLEIGYDKVNREIAKIRLNKKLFEIDFEKDIKIVRYIDKGGSDSVIYEVKWNKITAAFKVFRLRIFQNDLDNFTEFEREIEIMSQLHHPNILQLFGASIKSGVNSKVGILMEYASRGNLKQFLTANKKIKFAERIGFVKDICRGMIYIHSKEICHRDLKLTNCLVSDSVIVKICDFGLSKSLSEYSQNTQAIGTSIYMSPEILTGKRYNKKCDIFSFSIMLWEIVNYSFRPYGKDMRPAAIPFAVANSPYFRPTLKNLVKSRELNWLVPILRNCWDEEPNSRMSFREILERILKIENGGEEESSEKNE